MVSAAELSAMRASVADLMDTTAYILRLSYTPDGYGGIVPTWGTAGTVTVRLDPLRGGEALQGGAVQPFHGWQLTAPYDTDLQDVDRVKIGANEYAVKSVDGAKAWAVTLRAVLEAV